MIGPRRDIDVLLFDLGGVLVEFSGIDDLRPLLRSPVEPSEIRARWMASALVRDFEIGALSPADFGRRFVEQWDLVVSPAVFLAEFRSWSRAMFPGALELLASLRPRYRLAALSNSNPLHWERNTDELGVTGLFDVAMSSHQLGFHKPESAIYRKVLNRLGVRAQSVAFFDDVEANVEGARREGFMAFRVCGIEGLERCLREQGFLRGC